ncbi:MAG: DUF3108 domain-containing protein [Nitrospira sp.]|nr:DUF3108 domain-containing protein [Nitrospira sp.]
MTGRAFTIAGLLLLAFLGPGGPAESADAPAGPLGGLSKEQGNGSRFKMYNEGNTYDLQVGLIRVDTSAGRVVIEVFAESMMSDPLWQQFRLSAKGSRPTVEAGYIQVGNQAPMRLPDTLLSGMGNLDMSFFLLSEAELLGSAKKDGPKSLGQEKLQTPAGAVTCSHFRVERSGQQLDFWVSDAARPIGLVRMVSVGKKPSENYKLELQELLSGIAAKIDPVKAGPLSEEMKAILTRR